MSFQVLGDQIGSRTSSALTVLGLVVDYDDVRPVSQSFRKERIGHAQDNCRGTLGIRRVLLEFRVVDGEVGSKVGAEFQRGYHPREELM